MTRTLKDVNILLNKADSLTPIIIRIVTMIQKIENCLYCGNKMESITAKKKFCSPKCKVYFNREKKVEKILNDSFGKNQKEFNKSFLDLHTLGISITHTTETGKIKRIDPLSKEGQTVIDKSKEIPPMPIKQQGENAIDYAARKNEWKIKYNQI